jgi:hypothetical protein
MKGLKLYGLLGTCAIIAAASLPAWAADQDKGGFNEPVKGSDRGVPLDKLIQMLKEQQSHLQTDHGSPHRSALTPPTVHPAVAKTGAAGQKAAVAHATKHPTPAAKNADHAVQLAVYSGHDSGAVVPASSSIADTATDVIEATLDHARARDGIPHYKSGDAMVVRLKAKRECNVMVFDYDNKGTLTQLFPNDYVKEPLLHQGQTYEVGGPSCDYDLRVSGEGKERIFVYAYPASEGPITVAMNPVAGTPFRSVSMSPDQYSRLLRQSRTYFDELRASQTKGATRGVAVMPRSQKAAVVQPTSATMPNNKVELQFSIEK